jgi:outer membrane protein TolC
MYPINLLHSQTAYTLKQALEYGLKNSYNITISKLDLQKSEKKVREVLAIGLPQINAEGNFTNYIDLPTTVIPANAFNPLAGNDLIGVRFGTNYNVTGGITFSQLIFDGSYLIGLQATKGIANLNRLLVEKTEINSKNDIAKAYYTAIVADENVNTLKQIFTNVEMLLNETKEIFKNGLIEEQDVDQINLTYLNIKNALTRAESMRDIAYALLKLQMGMPLTENITLAENTETILTSLKIEDFKDTSFLVTNNIDHKILQTQLELNALNVKNEKAERLPSLSAFFSHQQQAFRNDFDFFQNKPWYPATLWGIKLTIPIWASGMGAARIAQNELEYKKTEIQLKQTDESLKINWHNVQQEFFNAVKTYQAEKQSLALAENIQRKTLAKYKEGVSSSMELNQAQTQYLQTQANYINSILQMLNAKAALDNLNQTNPK